MDTQYDSQTNQDNGQFAFGDALTIQEREYLVDHSRIRAFHTGERLCCQNKIDNVLYVILMGEVEVVEENNEAHKITLGKLHSGELVGEIAALFRIPRIASVYATRHTVALEVPANEFSGLLKKTPMLNRIVYEKLYERSLDTALRCVHEIKEQDNSEADITQEISHWQKDSLN